MKSTRRDFLKQVTAITAAAAIPGTVLTADAKAKKPQPRKIKAGEKVNLACVGIGGRGGDILNEFVKTDPRFSSTHLAVGNGLTIIKPIR